MNDVCVGGCMLRHRDVDSSRRYVHFFEIVSRLCAFICFISTLQQPELIEDETFNNSDIIMKNLIDYEDGQEEPDSLRADTIMQESSFPKN
ncbi:UNVERIFIED_CONTAM: hypothetical protein NCL1_44149 [Trichonephila clavipes]